MLERFSHCHFTSSYSLSQQKKLVDTLEREEIRRKVIGKYIEDEKPGGKKEREVRKTKDFHSEVMSFHFHISFISYCNPFLFLSGSFRNIFF